MKVAFVAQLKLNLIATSATGSIFWVRIANVAQQRGVLKVLC